MWITVFLSGFEAVGRATGRASGLQKATAKDPPLGACSDREKRDVHQKTPSAADMLYHKTLGTEIYKAARPSPENSG